MARSLVAALACSWLVVSGPVLADGDAAAGKAKSATCTACHGADGNSTNPEWPKLAGQHAGYLAKQVRDIKQGETRTNPLMAPMVANLSDQDIEDLAAYYASQPAAGGYVSEEKKAMGERLYRGGNPISGTPACIACHGPRGEGNGLAGFPRLSGQYATYTAKQLTDWRNGARANDPNGMMRDAAKFLTPDEIGAVAEYVSGLH